MIQQFGPIAFGTSGQVGFLSMSSGDPAVQSPADVKPQEDLRTSDQFPWALWGSDNLLPKKMVEDIEACGVLAAAIDGKARFGMGKGPKAFKVLQVNPDGSEDLQAYNYPEVDAWLEENDFITTCFAWFKDMIGMANYACRFKFNNAGTKIGLAVRDDITAIRFRKQEPDGTIKSVFLGSDWSRIMTNDTNSPLIREIPLLPHIAPANMLMEMPPEQRAAKEFALTGRIPAWQRHYYSMPTWYAAKKWVDIAKSVPAMKAAMFANNIRLKYIVVIYDTYWSRQYGADWATFTKDKQDDLQRQTYDSIENWLVGSTNAYKSIFLPGNSNPVTGVNSQDIEIKTIDDSTKAGELLPDSAAANSEILFALMMNPALMGADMPGGPYSGGAGSGSNIREAALVQIMIQEFERQQLQKILNIVKKVNGWPEDMVFRFPGMILTTLDTGKSTKNVTTGG